MDKLSVEKFEGYYIITDGDFKGAFIYPKNRIVALNSVYTEKEIQDFKNKIKISKNMEWL